MSYMYFLLSVAGWVWLAVVALFLLVRLCIIPRWARRGTARGSGQGK
jgi:hypothetical protein